MSERAVLLGSAEVCEGTHDARLKEMLRGMAATRSPVVQNGRFFYCEELNALTYWYEDHNQSTRMVYVPTGA